MTATPEPDPSAPWTDVGREYVPEDRRPEFLHTIEKMAWVPPTGKHPLWQALALDETLERFQLRNVAAISYDTTWPVPDGPLGTADYTLLGVRTDTLRLVLLDRGFDVRVVHVTNLDLR